MDAWMVGWVNVCVGGWKDEQTNSSFVLLDVFGPLLAQQRFYPLFTHTSQSSTNT